MRAVAVGRRPYVVNRVGPESTGAPARRHKPDYWLLIITLGLLAVGVIVVYSISPALAVGDGTADGSAYVTRQLIAIALGLALFALAARVPIRVWRKAAPVLLVLAGLATLFALIAPINDDYPAQRWIRFGGLSFQSVELVKVAFMLWFASFLLLRKNTELLGNAKKTLYPIFGMLAGIGIVVVELQSDLGSGVVLAAMLLVMAFVSGIPMKWVGLVVGVTLVGGLLFIMSTGYRQERVATFLNPSADCLDAGYQACQALIAIGSGGMTGLGLGNSVQAYGYLPEAENDSIFAIYAEKFGFLGVTALLGLLLALYGRLKRIMDRTPDEYNRLIVLGVFVWLSTQAIMNIGAMIGLLPLKGITLPLISYGGSSVLMVLFALGLVFQISRYTTNRTIAVKGEFADDDSRMRRRVRGAHYAAPGGRR